MERVVAGKRKVISPLSRDRHGPIPAQPEIVSVVMCCK